MTNKYGFKDLQVWQRAMDLADYIISVIENLSTPKNHFRLIEQFESASASVAQNIAEGKGRYSDKEFIRFLYIARGSLYEIVTLTDLFYRRRWINYGDFCHIQDQSFEIAAMIKGLINKLE